jgi:SAM-dependent methyltransferase
VKIDPNLLQCPSCKNRLHLGEYLYCTICNKSYYIKDKKYSFLDSEQSVDDELDKVKYFLKKFPRFYRFLTIYISPVYGSFNIRKLVTKEINNKDCVVINLGSGNYRISDKIVNIDLFPYDNVDLICDISNLPITDNCVDVIINIAVLEHVNDPEKNVSEMERVLKPGGKIFVYVPFIVGYHASPHDFQRYTISGTKELFKKFDIISLKCGAGPTSGLLWILQEWLAIILSFGIKPLYRFLLLFIMCITFPIKYLDTFLVFHPSAQNIASGFLIIAKKKQS